MNDNILREKCRRIRLVISDVDGILTDGGMYYSEHGEELKKFNVRDGAGVALLHAAGIKVGLLSGENSQSTERRANKIGCDFCRSGVRRKKEELDVILQEYNLDKQDVAFIGDEINDYPLLDCVGVFFTVSDGCKEIRKQAHLVLGCKGGEGALRAAADVILSYRGETEQALKIYFEQVACLGNASSSKGESA